MVFSVSFFRIRRSFFFVFIWKPNVWFFWAHTNIHIENYVCFFFSCLCWTPLNPWLQNLRFTSIFVIAATRETQEIYRSFVRNAYNIKLRMRRRILWQLVSGSGNLRSRNPIPFSSKRRSGWCYRLFWGVSAVYDQKCPFIAKLTYISAPAVTNF